MIKNKSVCAVVVTYNRSGWLIQCLQSLIEQNHTLQGIIVINNASTDDTRDRLDSFSSEYSTRLNWHIVHSTINTGGSGGFARGMQLAHEQGYDWIWVMDDDVLAHPDGLRDLLEFSEQAQILHGRRLGPDGQPFYWQSTFLSWLGFCRPYPDSAFKEKRIWYTNVACFEGALIHRTVFDSIGYANERYFIAWDDTEFGYRASEFFKIAYCDCLTLSRQRGHDNIDIGLRSLYRASDMYRYFHIRNRFLLIQTILNREHRLWARILKRCTFHGFTLVLITKEIVRAALFKDWSLGLNPLLRGLKDGALGRFGSMS